MRRPSSESATPSILLRAVRRGGAVATLLVLAGCASHGERAPAAFVPRAHVAAFHRVAIAPLDLDVLETDAAGRSVPVPDRRAVISGRLSTALERRTQWPSFTTHDVQDETARRELADVQALLREFTAAAIARENADDGAPAAELRFGRIDALADALRADGVLLVYTYDRSTSAARKLVAAGPTVLALSTGVNVGPHAGVTVSGAALVARDGRVLWFGTETSTGRPQLAADSERLVDRLIAGLPLAP